MADPSSLNRASTNKLGIDNPEVRARVEAAVTRLRFADLAQQPLPHKLDFEHLKSIHNRAFSDVSEKAGTLRTSELPKTLGAYAAPKDIETRGKELLDAVAAENNLRDIPNRRFVQRSAHYLAELHKVSAFQDGDGRTERAFMLDLARGAGRRLDFSRVERKRLDDALKLSLITDQSRPMEHIIVDALVREPEQTHGPSDDRERQR